MDLRDRTRAQDAWTAFWQDPASRLQCVSGAPDITHALRSHWRAFATLLAPGARALDLGCGAGAASMAIDAAGQDLRLTGVDFARVPVPAGHRLKLVCDTPMESLPFAEASFDAAISQFGFEYSRTHKTAHQLARVLAPGARFSFVVHHAGSSVVATNRARLNAILAMLGPQMRAAFLAGNVFVLNARLASLRREHPGDALVAEFARLLPLRAKADGRKAAAWSALEAALAPEMTILEAMDACCVAPEELEGWLGPLRQSCTILSTTVLRKPNDVPIAWCIEGMRSPQQ